MTPQWDDDNAVYSDRTAFVWAVGPVKILLLSTAEALASERVPDLVLSYVFTHKMPREMSPSSTNSQLVS
jgi:hypothetical protein